MPLKTRFDRLPIHWMWWPALGAVAVGIVGYFAPDTLGVGYYNITAILSDGLPIKIVFFLCLMKFLSWSISLSSGTSGGTLAPLLTIGAGLGQTLGAAAIWLLPHAGIDLRVAALVGMAALFAGASPRVSGLGRLRLRDDVSSRMDCCPSWPAVRPATSSPA